MHSGGGNSNVVSVAPATPIIKHMIGIAALVLEGRERSNAEPQHPYPATNSTTTAATKSKDAPMNFGVSTVIPRVALASTSSAASGASMYTILDPTAVPAALSATNSTTASGATSNWARTQNQQLAHIYRIKNRLLVESGGGGGAGGQQSTTSNRSSPVPVDYDLMIGGGGMGLDLEDVVFDPMLHLTSARTSRLTTPRSYMNLTMPEKRQTSASSSSSTVSSQGGAAGSVSNGSMTSASRRNSRSSPVPTLNSIGGRAHCDDFLRTIGLLKGSNSNPVGPSLVIGKISPGMAVNKAAPFVAEAEPHYCDEFVSSEVSGLN